jgi:predicted Zn finger-like uncharacterized protein
MSKISTFDCDECDTSFAVASTDIENHESVKCPGCGETLEIENDED